MTGNMHTRPASPSTFGQSRHSGMPLAYTRSIAAWDLGKPTNASLAGRPTTSRPLHRASSSSTATQMCAGPRNRATATAVTSVATTLTSLVALGSAPKMMPERMKLPDGRVRLGGEARRPEEGFQVCPGQRNDVNVLRSQRRGTR